MENPPDSADQRAPASGLGSPIRASAAGDGTGEVPAPPRSSAPSKSPRTEIAFLVTLAAAQILVEGYTFVAPQLAKLFYDSFMAMSGLTIATFSGLIIGSLLGGPAVDRFSSLPVYRWAMPARIATGVGLTLLFLANGHGLPGLLALAGLFAVIGMENSFLGASRIAESAFAAERYGSSEQAAVNRFGIWRQVVMAGIGIAGLLGSSWLVQTAGLAVVLPLLAVVMTAASLIAAFFLRGRLVDRPLPGKRFRPAQFGAAWRALRESSLLRRAAVGLALVSTMSAFLYFMVAPAFGIFVAGQSGVEAAAGKAVGITSPFAIGAFLATLVSIWSDSRLKKKLARLPDDARRAMERIALFRDIRIWSWAAAAAYLGFWSLLITTPVAGILPAKFFMLLLGFATLAVAIPLQSLLVIEAPQAIRGAVIAAVQAIRQLIIILGVLPLGLLFNHFSEQQANVRVPMKGAFIGVGLLATAAAALWLYIAGTSISHSWKTLPTAPGAEAEALDRLKRNLRELGLPPLKTRRAWRAVDGRRPTVAILGSPSVEALTIAKEGAIQTPGDVLLALDPSWLIAGQDAAGKSQILLKKGLYFDPDGAPVIVTYRKPRPVHAFADWRKDESAVPKTIAVRGEPSAAAAADWEVRFLAARTSYGDTPIVGTYVLPIQAGDYKDPISIDDLQAILRQKGLKDWSRHKTVEARLDAIGSKVIMELEAAGVQMDSVEVAVSLKEADGTLVPTATSVRDASEDTKKTLGRLNPSELNFYHKTLLIALLSRARQEALERQGRAIPAFSPPQYANPPGAEGKRLFGLEAEMIGLTRQQLAEIIQSVVGGTIGENFMRDYTSRKLVVAADGRVWKVADDESLNVAEPIRAEIVFPVLTEDDIPTIKKIVALARDMGARVNSHCGVHFHGDARAAQLEHVNRLIDTLIETEPVVIKGLFQTLMSRLLAFTRLMSPDFIKEFRAHRPRTWSELWDLWYGQGYDPTRKQDNWDKSRNRGLNLQSFAFRKTTELRYFDGTVDPDRIEQYIRFGLAVMERSGIPRYSAKTDSPAWRALQERAHAADLSLISASAADMPEVLDFIKEIRQKEFDVPKDEPQGPDGVLFDLGPDQFDNFYGGPGARFVVLKDADGRILGTAGMNELRPGVAEMKKVYVSPELRGRKLGEAFVDYLIEEARSIGYTRMELDTLKKMVPAHKLYRKKGFVEFDPGYPPDPRYPAYINFFLDLTLKAPAHTTSGP